MDTGKKSFGQVAYEAYMAVTRMKGVSPEWAALPKEVRNGWDAAAKAVKAEVRKEVR